MYDLFLINFFIFSGNKDRIGFNELKVLFFFIVLCTYQYQKKILAWYKKYQRKLPWRKYKSQKDRHYKVLLSEFMLQQTQVKTAIPYFNNFYKNIDSIEKLSNASQTRVNKLWQGLGYYRRAKYLLETSKIISKKYNSKLPQNYCELIKLQVLEIIPPKHFCLLHLIKMKLALMEM